MAPILKLGNIDIKKRTSQKLAFGIFTLLSYLVVVILFLILGFIIIKGGKVISWDFLTEAPAEGMTAGGIYPAIVGTLYLVLGSSLISFPIGIMSGIYMNEYATNGKLIRFIRIMTNNLSGVPSVVFGLFGMSLFVVTLGRLDHCRFIHTGIDVVAADYPHHGRGLEKYRRLVPSRESGTGSYQVTDYPASGTPDGFSEYHYRADPVGGTCIGRDGSYPVHCSRLLPASAAGKYL